MRKGGLGWPDRKGKEMAESLSWVTAVLSCANSQAEGREEPGVKQQWPATFASESITFWGETESGMETMGVILFKPPYHVDVEWMSQPACNPSLEM